LTFNGADFGNGNASLFGGKSASGVEFLPYTMAEWAVQDQESASYFDGELFGDHATDTGNFLLENKY
jgi:hypothetical protein